MQRYRILLILILFSFNNFLFSLPSFQISCKIQDSILISMEDGKSTRYSKYKGDIGVGDNLYLYFEIIPSDLFTSIPFEMKMQTNIQAPWNFEKNYENLNGLRMEENFLNDENIYLNDNKIVLGEDFISIDAAQGFEVHMTRYYKNDWNLFFTTNDVLSFQIKSANCLSVSNK